MRKITNIIILSVMVMTFTACQNIIEGTVKKGLNRQTVEMLTDGKLHVFLVGSGGPMNNTERVSTCTAVIAAEIGRAHV